MADYLPSPRLSVMFGQFFAALQLIGSHLHVWGETSLPQLHPCPSALSFLLDQHVQVWMARMVEEEEEEIWEKRRKFRLDGLPRCTFSELRFYKVHQTSLGFPLDAHLVRSDDVHLLLKVNVNRCTLGR